MVILNWAQALSWLLKPVYDNTYQILKKSCENLIFWGVICANFDICSLFRPWNAVKKEWNKTKYDEIWTKIKPLLAQVREMFELPKINST